MSSQAAKPDEDDLLLSFNEAAGAYQQDGISPHQKMNEKNAILINTKDPLYYQQAYEHTLQKNFEKF